MILPFGNARRTGEHLGAAISGAPETAWVFRGEAKLTGSPAWDGDLVVVLDVDGGVHGLEAGTGEPRWSHQNEWGPASPSGSAVITATGVLHLHEEEIVELDRRTGEVNGVWDWGGQHITAFDGVLLVDGAYAVDLATRTGLWEAPGASLLAPPATHDGIMVVTDGFEGHHVHGGVHAFRYGTGERLWSIGDRQNAECVAPARNMGDNTGDWEVPGLTHPVIAEGRVWFTRLRGHEDGAWPHVWPWDAMEFVGCDLKTGTEEWTWTPFPRRYHFQPFKAPAYTDRLLLCVTATAELDAADGSPLEPGESRLTAVNTRTAEPAWSSPLDGFPVGSPALAGGVVHVVTRDGTIVALESTTGEARWTYTCGEPLGVTDDDLADTAPYEEEPARLVPGDGSVLVQTARSVRLLR
ncbi:PQQ-binding-like beta-propeller repeat protein [Spirillospora sp. NPDC048824]|uniref:outer membrane protein assembly factor BamB family protein n=1 Tax=Spirillospora sp. NPDC048824 TaxID=3364526 RepID=UPI00371C89F7